MGEQGRRIEHAVLDARYLACPLPVLKARKRLEGLPSGAILEVLTTDPAAKSDFPDFARTSGHVLLETREDPGGVFRFLLQRNGH